MKVKDLIEELKKLDTEVENTTESGTVSTSGMAITALITGILSICLFPLAIVSLILSYIEWGNIEDGVSAEQGKTMIITGSVFAVVSLVLTIVGYIAIFFL